MTTIEQFPHKFFYVTEPPLHNKLSYEKDKLKQKNSDNSYSTVDIVKQM